MTHYDWHSRLMRYLDNSLKVRYIVFRIANALQVDRLRLLINQLPEVLRLISIYELGLDPESREEHLELVISAAIQVGRRNNIVASMCEGRNGHELSSLT